MQHRRFLAVVGVVSALFVICGTFLQLQPAPACPEVTILSAPAPVQPHIDPAALIEPPLPSWGHHQEKAGREPEAFDLLRIYWQCPAMGFESLSRSFLAWRGSPFGLGDAHPSDAMDAYVKDRKEANDTTFLCGVFRAKVREGGRALYSQEFCPVGAWAKNRLDGLRCFLSKARVAPDVDFFFWHHDGPLAVELDAPAWGPVPLASAESNFPFVIGQSIDTPSRLATELLQNSKILPTDARIGLEVPFEQKKRQAVWRGSTTGGRYTADNWRDKLRTKLVLFSQQYPDLLDAGFTGFVQTSNEARQEMRELVIAPMPMETQCRQYRALVVVDGNSSPDRLARQLACGTSVVLWQISNYPGDNWFSELRSWVHYVPLRPDLSDLEERLRLVLDDSPRTVEWMKAIARGGRDFILHRLSPSMIKCHWLEFLHSLASITPPRSVESEELSGDGWQKLAIGC